MAVTADKVVVELELKDGQYLAKVKQAERQFSQSQDRMAGSAKNAERQIKASSQQIGNALRNMAGAIAAGASASAIKGMADSYTQMGNRLKVIGEEAGTSSDQFERLMQVATESRMPIESVVNTYARLTNAMGEMGYTSAQVTDLTETLSKTLKSSGASAQEAASLLLQISQGLGSGVLAGDELRAIRENPSAVARAIAAEFNTTVGGLKKLGEEGVLTSDRVAKAILASKDAVDAAWADTVPTISDAFERLRNNLVQYIGEADKAGGYSERLGKALVSMADNIDKIAPALGLIATLVASKWAGGMIAASLASDGFVTKFRTNVIGIAALQAKQTADVAKGVSARIGFINAEIAALNREIATGRNAAGMYTSRAAAAERLAVAERGLAAAKAQGATADAAAAAATARNATAMGRAGSSLKAFGSGLAALAGGPIGITTLAVGGLTYVLVNLTKAERDYGDASKEVVQSVTAVEKATDAYAKAAETAATATGKGAKEARALAEANRKAAIEARDLAKSELLVAQAIVTAINAQAQQMLDAERFNIRGDRPGSLQTVGRDDEYKEAMANSKALMEQIKETNKAIADADAELAKKTPSSVTEEDKGKGAKDRSKDQARLLADLEQQTKIEEAQLKNDIARVRELEREAEVVARIRQLKDAGLSEQRANEVNAGIQTRLDAARLEAMQDQAEAQRKNVELTIREIAENFEVVRQKRLQLEYEELVAEYKKTSQDTTEAEKRALEDINSLEEARLDAANKYLQTQSKSYALRVAEAIGNDKLVRQLRDQEEIIRRTNELREKGRMSPEAARERATLEVTTERSATEYAAQREMFANSFSEGIRAAMSGDLNGFLASQFGNLADMAFKSLGETLFESFKSAPADVVKAQAEGAAQGATAGVAMATSITAAGATAATAMGASITASGMAVAAAIAAANVTSSIPSFLPFGGMRANGGPVRAGSSYTVGENGRENFVPSQNGYIIPNMKNMKVGGGQPSVVKLIVDEGSMFSARVQQISGPIAVQASVGAASYSQESMRTQRRRQSQSFV